MKFIESPETQQGLPPFFFPGVSINSFKVPADKKLLGDYCNEFLNLTNEYHFSAADEFVYIGINTYPRLYSNHPSQNQTGYLIQDEYFIMFPVIKYDLLLGNYLSIAEFMCVFPYMGVNNSTSTFTGQEVLGLPKLDGEIDIVRSNIDSSFTADVRMPAFSDTGRNVPQEMLKLIHVDSGPSIPFVPPTPNQVFPWLPRHPDYLDGLVDALYGTGVLKSFSVVSLKQFREGADPLNAAYQALVSCDCRVKPVSDWIEYQAPEIEVFSNATFDIVGKLGLTLKTNGKVQVDEAYGLVTDMWFENVSNLAVL